MSAPQNTFKQAIKGSSCPIGTWCMMASPDTCEALSCVGFDFLVVDMEHAPNDIPEALAQLRAIASGGNAHGVVRLPVNDPVIVKRALDIGAQTLMFPMINSAEDARRAVDATYYAPRGVRGFAAMHRGSRYTNIPNYPQFASENICRLMQIETARAVENIAEIAAVEGVDGLFVGPGDLAASMGLVGQLNHPKVQEMLVTAVKACQAAGKPAGILAHSEEAALLAREQGYSYVAVSSDFGFLMRTARTVLERVK